MTRRFLLVLCVVSLGTTCGREAWGQIDPQTRAEATGYRETSRYDDVITFLDGLRAKGAPISVQFIGTSTQGRKIPLVVASRPLPTSRDEARRLNKPIVCIQANIHAGEVEGKEAVDDVASGSCRLSRGWRLAR